MLIYKATIIITNKSYVGLIYKEGKTLQQRVKQHIELSKIKDKQKKKNYFHRSIKKYGSENLKWQILEDDIQTLEQLKQKQTFYIIKYDTYVSNEEDYGGYNLTLGGDGVFGYHFDDNQRKQISIKCKQNAVKYWLGKKLSLQHKINMSTGKKKYFKEHPERIQKMREEKIGIAKTKQQIQANSVGNKKRWDNNPQRKIQMSQRIKKYNSDNKQKKLLSIQKMMFTKSLNKLNKQCISHLDSINFMLR